MSLLLRYVWFTKVCLTGWSAYRACVGDSSNVVICFMSVTYFGILCFATVITWKTFVKPRQIENLEGEYLRRLEEGVGFGDSNQKPE
jgi:hypothetical protein